MGRKSNQQQNDGSGSGKLRIIPLGGLGEIGKNMMYIEYNSGTSVDSIIIDAGIMFPENDMLGVDYIIPDYSAIMDRMDTVRAVFITHGHEDHTGAIAHLMEHVYAPIYATSLTVGLLDVKLRRGKRHECVNLLRTVQAGDTIEAGPFSVELYHVCHSIPDSVGLGITTPVGLIVHTGDFKFDHTPVDGWPPDFGKLAEFARRGVLLLMSDSTNADRAGWTPSETVIDAAFDDVFREAKGRIIIGTFASLISRIQQVANAADRYGKKMVISGTSMVENIKMARELGYLDIPDSLLIEWGQAEKLPNDRIVIMTTGTQGEPGAGLSRIATGQHKQIEVEPFDTVIMSSHPIPGNEEGVNRTINKLIQRGAEVLYDPVAPVHVSGHAAREELKLLINLVRPRFFLPIHGELHHLHMHSKLAMELGIPRENIAVVENGTVLTLTADSMEVGERVPGGYVFVDGSVVGDIGPTVMRDREQLGQSGFVLINLTLTRDTREIIGEPEIISRGFVYQRESQDLLEGAQVVIAEVVHSSGSSSARDLRFNIQRRLERYFYGETKRRPMIFAFVNEV